MRRKEIKELVLKSKEELENLLKELRSELAQATIGKGRKGEKKISPGEKKKDIARVLTIIRQKELENQ